jgi:hypothetical protein
VLNNLDYLNSKLVLRLPWDEAGNPGRYNNPSYPVTSDLFYNDSSEIIIPVHILNDNAKPWISKIQFTNYQSVGVVEYNQAGDQITATQGFINNNYPSGTLECWLDGLPQRAIVTNYKADVSAISSMDNAQQLEAIPFGMILLINISLSGILQILLT